MKRNVFVIATEYHFLVTMSIIETSFSGKEWKNEIVLTHERTNGILADSLPASISIIRIAPIGSLKWRKYLKQNIYNTPLDNLFVVHAFRELELAFLYLAPKGVKRYLMQDGALFYNMLERNLFLGRLRQTLVFYKDLLSRGLLMIRPVIYGRYEEKSPFIDGLWMTNPEIYRLPNLKKEKKVFSLFPKEDSAIRFSKYFEDSSTYDFSKLNKALLYIAPKVATEEKIIKEIEVLKHIMTKFNLENILIKIHPLELKSLHYNMLKAEFGDMVIANYTPADIYIANAINSIVVSSASTALIYNNKSCRYFALKNYYQNIGIYDAWKNITLPGHVKMVKKLEDLE